MSAPALRPYQLAAVDAIRARYVAGDRATLLVLPTGCGKTHCFVEIARRVVERGGRVLVVAHREELLAQAADKLVAIGIAPGIERAKSRAGDAEVVVVASVQTLRGARLASWPHDAFRLVVIDEAHHAIAAGYRAIVERFAGARILGVTATPDRLDGAALGEVFESVAFRYELRDAIRDGWLCRIEARRVHLEAVDLDRVHTRAGDLDAGELAEELGTEQAVRGVVEPLLELAGDRRTILFAVTVAHAEHLAAALNERRPRIARAASGEMSASDRREVVDAFRVGALRVLVNCQLYTEGFDVPEVDCIAVARPTKSRALYAQCIDAQTEILTESGWCGIDDELGRVAACNLEDGTVHWSIAEKIVRPLGDEEMYGIDNPHLSLRVTAGHRMVVRTRHGSQRQFSSWRFARADDLPVSFRVPLAGKSMLPDADVADADLSFLGLLLTDGNLNPANNCISLYQSERYPDVIEHIERTLAACGFKSGHDVVTAPSNFGPRAPLHRWTLCRGAPRGRDKHLTGWARLERWIGPDGKSLTAAFEQLSARQVGVLLAAMHLGNGLKHAPETWTPRTLTISFANERLGSQVQSLLVRRGYRCNLARLPSKAVSLHIGQDTEWSVVRRAADHRPLWGCVSSDASELVWCASVDTGAIVVRRDGKVAVVGNCIGRGTRLAPGKASLLVLDFVGNSRRHRLVTPAAILAGAGVAPDVVRAAEAGSGDVLVELEQAEAAQRARGREQRVRFWTELADLFGFMPEPEGSRPATPRQLAALGRAGVKAPVDLSQSAADEVLAALAHRREQGLATYKQVRFLARHGVDAREWTFEQAHARIGRLMARWRRRSA